MWLFHVRILLKIESAVVMMSLKLWPRLFETSLSAQQKDSFSLNWYATSSYRGHCMLLSLAIHYIENWVSISKR